MSKLKEENKGESPERSKKGKDKGLKKDNFKFRGVGKNILQELRN